MTGVRTELRAALVCLALVVPLGVVACDDASSATEVCVSEAVQARNPATGACEWVSSCDLEWEICQEGFACEELPAEVCELDDGCELAAVIICVDCVDPTVSCGCESTVVCVAKQLTSCAELDETACMATQECEVSYGWRDTAGPSPTDEGDVYECADACDDVASAAEWGFVACLEAGTGP